MAKGIAERGVIARKNDSRSKKQLLILLYLSVFLGPLVGGFFALLEVYKV